LGSKWFFDPSKGAFRAGGITNTKGSPTWWDADSVGISSFAAGVNTKAKGLSSVAMGDGGEADGTSSVSIGHRGNARANYSVVIGRSGLADGDESIAIGTNSFSKSFREIAIGSYNTDYTINSATTWNVNDRLLVLGNGENSSARSNAIVILKNGNVGIGENTPALKLIVSNDASFHGVRVGRGLGNYTTNTLLGAGAFDANSTGQFNTIVGNLAMSLATSANNNVAIGYSALSALIGGGSNVAIGREVMTAATSAGNNIAIGREAMLRNTSGGDNVAVGRTALANNTTGTKNVALGFEALGQNTTGNAMTANIAIGYRAGGLVTTGYGNVLIGEETGKNISTGYDNTWVGKQIGNSGTLTWENTSALGNSTPISANNQVNLGNTAITQIRAQVTGITAYSDERYKIEVKEDVKGLDFITKLKPVTYYQRPKELHKIWGTPQEIVDGINHDEIEAKRSIGFIAQEVFSAAKESGFEFPGLHMPKNEHDVYAINYTEFIMPLVKAFQELNNKTDANKLHTETELEVLKKQNEILQEQVNILLQQNKNILLTMENMQQIIGELYSNGASAKK
jgi:trimeric autotransporter adhesin